MKSAFKNTYAYEWQGDSLLLARESMLFTFIENYKHKFRKEPLLKSIQEIAYIISWNVWQMDGLKGVVPFSCGEIKTKSVNLFGEEETDELEEEDNQDLNLGNQDSIYHLDSNDFEDKTKTVLQRKLSQLDVVTREEFDIQTQVLIKTRAKLTELEARLAELEESLPSKGSVE